MADIEFIIKSDCKTYEPGGGHVHTTHHDYVHFKNSDRTRSFDVNVQRGILDGFPAGGISIAKAPSANSSSYRVVGRPGSYNIGITSTGGPACPLTETSAAPQIIIDD